MIKSEIVIFGNKSFVRSYSDSGMMIERDGVVYDEAFDPTGEERNYTETDQLIKVEV